MPEQRYRGDPGHGVIKTRDGMMKTEGGEKSEIESIEGVDVFTGHGMWLSEGKHRELWYRQEELLTTGSVNCA